jgi:hypothetical protein
MAEEMISLFGRNRKVEKARKRNEEDLNPMKVMRNFLQKKKKKKRINKSDGDDGDDKELLKQQQYIQTNLAPSSFLHSSSCSFSSY